MTSEQKVRLMIVPRNDAGVPTTTSFSGTVEARRELYRELEAEGLVEIEGPTDFPGSNWSDVYTVNVTSKGRAFLREHWRPIPSEPTCCDLLDVSGNIVICGLCQDTHIETDPTFAAPDALGALTQKQIEAVSTLRLVDGSIVPVKDFRAHHGTHYHFRVSG